MTICRGIIYHKISDDLLNLCKSLYCKLDDKKKIKNFEIRFKRFNHSKYCLTYPFARSAFLSILKTDKNIKPGDEIILSSIQIKGMLDVIVSLKLKPVIVDIEPNTLNFDLKDLKKKITKKTKVVLLTYLYGVVPNLDKILNIIKKKKIILVEDFSQCLGGMYKNKIVGNFGDFGIYSLSATKTLDTYGGGILVTNKKQFFKKNLIFHKNLKSKSRLFLIFKIFQSLYRNIFSKKILFYFIIKIFKFLNFFGYKNYSRFLGKRSKKIMKFIPSLWFTSFTSLQAEFGSKLLNTVKFYDRKRISNVMKIKEGVGKQFFPTIEKRSFNVFWQLAFINKKSEKIRLFALSKNIDIARPSIQLLSNILKTARLKRSRNIYDNLILIPSYHSLNAIEVSKINSVIKKVCKK